jgi:hypothetical protein
MGRKDSIKHILKRLDEARAFLQGELSKIEAAREALRSLVSKFSLR